MYPKTADEWWALVDEHWADIQGIFFLFLPMWEHQDIEGNFLSKQLYEHIDDMKKNRNRDLERYFSAAWGAAPDVASIRDIPGWHILCDLCSEVEVERHLEIPRTPRDEYNAEVYSESFDPERNCYNECHRRDT